MFIQDDYDNLMKKRQELMKKQCSENDRNRGVKSSVMYVLEVRFRKERVSSEISQILRIFYSLSSVCLIFLAGRKGLVQENHGWI